MRRADEVVERAADTLEEAAKRAAERGGLAASLAAPLAEDATFLRRLKPSLVAARLRGEAPTDLPLGRAREAPGGPQVRAREGPGAGPNPFVVVGVALAVGILLAKAIDWRSHAHPRD